MPIMDTEKIKELKKLLRKGVPEGEIREDLKQEGHSEEEINAVFKPHHYDMRSWYLFFGIIITLIGLYLFFTDRGMLILALGILLFVAYYYEIRRLEKLNKMK
jgi:hypothetical protein